MTINRILLLCGAAFAVSSFTPATAQEQTDSILEIRLIDGSTLYGVLLDDSEHDAETAHIRLLSGDEMLIARARIRTISPAAGPLREGEFWRDDPNLTRLFFAPTARTMPKGGGYIAAYELLFPFVAVGVSDNLLLAGGTPIFGDIIDDRVVYFAPKLRVFSSERTDSALGGFLFTEVGNEYSNFNAGALYGVLTRSTSDRAVSLGVGAAYDDDGFLDEPIVMLGAAFRVSRTIKLITENYFIPDVSLITFGPRFFGERLSADLGIGLFIENRDVFTVPIVNFVYVWQARADCR
jgi:hypothetical protein